MEIIEKKSNTTTTQKPVNSENSREKMMQMQARLVQQKKNQTPARNTKH